MCQTCLAFDDGVVHLPVYWLKWKLQQAGDEWLSDYRNLCEMQALLPQPIVEEIGAAWGIEVDYFNK